jgi:hypothetical protein
MKRKKFLELGGRWILFGGLLGTSGYLLKHRPEGISQTCNISPVCKGCQVFNTCEKPLRKSKENERNG